MTDEELEEEARRIAEGLRTRLMFSGTDGCVYDGSRWYKAYGGGELEVSVSREREIAARLAYSRGSVLWFPMSEVARCEDAFRGDGVLGARSWDELDLALAARGF